MQNSKRLDAQVIETPDSIEKFFCEKFEKTERHKMDDKTTKLLMDLISLNETDIFSQTPKEEIPFLCKIIKSKLKTVFTYNIVDDRVILFIAHLAKTPGATIMYLWYLQYYCKKTDIKEVDFTIFFVLIFPRGFLSIDDLMILWEGQKIENQHPLQSDNLLDYKIAGKSIEIL